MTLKTLTFLFSCLFSFQCNAQLERIDSNDVFFNSLGNIMDTFVVKQNKNEVKEVLMTLNVNEYYLQCKLENFTDSALRLFYSCRTLKTFIEFSDNGEIVYPGGCDYDSDNYKILSPKEGFTIFVPKNVEWKKTALRIGLIVNENWIYSNWVSYE